MSIQSMTSEESHNQSPWVNEPSDQPSATGSFTQPALQHPSEPGITMAEQQYSPDENSSLSQEYREASQKVTNRVRQFVLETQLYRARTEELQQQPQWSMSELECKYLALEEQHDSLLKDKEKEDKALVELKDDLDGAWKEQHSSQREVRRLKEEKSRLVTQVTKKGEDVDDLTKAKNDLSKQLTSARRSLQEQYRFFSRSHNEHDDTIKDQELANQRKQIKSLQTEATQHENDEAKTMAILEEALANQNQLMQDMFQDVFISNELSLAAKTTFQNALLVRQRHIRPTTLQLERANQHYLTKSRRGHEDLEPSNSSHSRQPQLQNSSNANNPEQSSNRPMSRNVLAPTDLTTESNSPARPRTRRLSIEQISPKTLPPEYETLVESSVRGLEGISDEMVKLSQESMHPHYSPMSENLRNSMGKVFSGYPNEQLWKRHSGQQLVPPGVSPPIRSESLPSSVSTDVKDLSRVRAETVGDISERSSIIIEPPSSASVNEVYEQSDTSHANTDHLDSVGLDISIKETNPNTSQSTDEPTSANATKPLVSNYRSVSVVSIADSWSSTESKADQPQSSQQDQLLCAYDSHNDVATTGHTRTGSAKSLNDYSTRVSRPYAASSLFSENITDLKQRWSEQGRYWYEVLFHCLEVLSTLVYDMSQQARCYFDRFLPSTVLLRLRHITIQMLAFVGACCSYIQQNFPTTFKSKIGSIGTFLREHGPNFLQLLILSWWIAMIWLLVTTHSLKEQWDKGNSARARIEVPIWQSEFWMLSPAASLGAIFIRILDQHVEPVSNFV